MPSHTSPIVSLIEGYKTLVINEAKAAASRATRLKGQLPTFLDGLRSASGKQKERERKEAPKFNLIRLLKLQEVEKYHSEILTDLLNPTGTHSQGIYFLERFLNRIGYGRLSAKLGPEANLEVRREFWINDSSRIDLVIRCLPWFEIDIENKIRAAEGTAQLQRYRKNLDTLEKERVIEEGLLLYLTIDPEDKSSGHEHIHISYRDDIRRWLKECLKVSLPAHVRYTIEQYVDSIQDL